MPNIAIVDDRSDFRTTLKRKIELSLKKLNQSVWSVIDIDPFLNIEDYVLWIKNNDIAILILDEKLQEVASGSTVNYNGSLLIEKIREALKEFPVFAITSYPNEPDLQSKFPLFDEILERDTFYHKSDEYVSRFLRAGQRFLTTHYAQLNQISKLSQKIASGTALQEEKEQLEALQTLMGLPYSHLPGREEWLKEYEDKLEKLEEISLKIDAFLNSGKQ
jgi:CheY-like chemotaxis protein